MERSSLPSRCLVAWLCLGLAGCIASGRYPLEPLEYPLSMGDRPKRTEEASGGTACREDPIPRRKAVPPKEAVQLARFESPSSAPEPSPALPHPARNGLDPPEPDMALQDEAGVLPPEDLFHPERMDQIADSAPAESEQAEGICRLDLATALAMVSGRNPEVAFAAQRYREAYARLEGARVLWLPSIRAGVSYNKHEGMLQSSSGAAFDSSRGSLYSGIGSKAVGTGSPAVPGVVAQFHLTDAIYQPRIAGHAATARREAARAVNQDLLLRAALGYLDLQKAAEERAIAEETLGNAQQLADLTATFARSGQGPQADADRARAELVVRKNDVTRSEEEMAVASARLAELLHLDPTTIILPSESGMVPVDLVTQETPLAELLATGLSNRPELAESRQLVCEAVQRYRRERSAPWLPSALLAVSYGGFGGGTGGTVGRVRDRFDLDLAAYWELRNFGWGDQAARQEARSRYDQARLRGIQVMDHVAREIVEAHAQAQARRKQMAVAESGIQAATDSYRRNMERIRAGEGLPIEVLQSIQALDEARREYLRTVVDYNAAEFRLHRALGWPIRSRS